MPVPVHHTTERLGGTDSVQICCSGCKKTIHFSTSRLCGDIKQRTPVVSLSLRLASFLSGIGYAGYQKLFQHHLGLHAVSWKGFHDVIEMVYPHIKMNPVS